MKLVERLCKKINFSIVKAHSVIDGPKNQYLVVSDEENPPRTPKLFSAIMAQIPIIGLKWLENPDEDY